MMFGSVIASPRSTLSSQQALDLANVYMRTAYNANNSVIALVLCHDAEVSLFQAKKTAKHDKNQTTIDGIATAYIDLGKLLERYKRGAEAKALCKKGEKLGGKVRDTNRFTKISRPSSIVQSLKGPSVSSGVSQASGLVKSLFLGKHIQERSVVIVPAYIFAENVRPPAIKLPETYERFDNTQQLAGCLRLLRDSRSPEDMGAEEHKWLEAMKKDIDEQDRLKTMVTEVIRAFKREELKDAKTVAEIVYLAPILSKDDFKDLLRDFLSGIDRSELLDVHRLEGMAQLIQDADPSCLEADDLVRILKLLSTRLQDTNYQSSDYMYQLTLSVSHVLDAMADTNVIDLDRENLHGPLSNYLEGLSKSSDPYLVYQAAYAYQALQCIPDDETTWQAVMRRTGKVIQGVSGLVSAVRGVDLNKFVEGLQDIQKGLEGVSKVAGLISTAYNDAVSLAQGGQGFLDSLKEGFSFEKKRDWYTALRGADAVIQAGGFAMFRELVCKAPCRLDAAFQWGVCQRLGEIAADPLLGENIRQDAITFLGEIYQNDVAWGQQVSIKQWILNILMQLSHSSGMSSQTFATFADKLLQDLGTIEDDKKKILYQICRASGPISYPARIIKMELGSPSLLDRVQNKPDVEGNMRQFRKKRTNGRSNAVYIPPQANSSLQAVDNTRFPLMEKVKEFLEGDLKVFLVLGDSGAGKSTFSREVEFELWQAYRAKTGRIPLHINLPSIDKPEHDMITKQLRKAEFTDQQIREMKHSRKFIVICDGYDECQQTHNLYMSNRLNQPGEWDAQMVISCRTEYLGFDYRDRFQPGDRNQGPDSSLLEEAVIAPFSPDQVQAYIEQYVSIRQSLWRSEDYKQALEHIPTLKQLVRNPFLMTVSLEVLPRLVDLGQDLTDAHVTRVELYDRFVELWLERGKKRISEKDLTPQSKTTFERLIDEGFIQNGIDFMKRLAVAIYKEQGGKPVVEYSQFMDEGSWKDAFFLRKDKQLLREACPLTRNGNQHRFIHRSLLEYGLACAVFDPQDRRNRTVPGSVIGRRGSVSSIQSLEIQEYFKVEAPTVEPDVSSPLVWRNLVNDHSLLQFLEERVQQEPVFRQQLLDYIEHSKKDKKWRIAAANAITILVRAGVQFIGADLQGVQIPRADLSYGVFDLAQLQDADLRKVCFRGTWLRQTDMSRAEMTGALFGELPFLAIEKKVFSCAYSPDGRLFAVGIDNGDINVYSTSNWERIRTLTGHQGAVWCVVYSPKGGQIASTCDDRNLRFWDSETGSLQYTLTGHSDWVRCVVYSPNGNQVASASKDRTIRLWDVVAGVWRQTLSGHNDGVFCTAYSPNGERIASGSEDHTIRLWNIESGECSYILSGHSDNVRGIVYSPRGDQVASASHDATVRLWNVDTGVCTHVLSGHRNAVFCIAYSPNGDQVASGGLDATVRIWDVGSGLGRHTLTGHKSTVMRLVYSPSGDQIASGNLDKTVRLWDISTEPSLVASSGHSMEVAIVKCSPKGDLIASCSSDRTIRLWDADTGDCRRILSGHMASVFGIAFSPQSDKIASGSTDNTVRLWDMETGSCLHILDGHSNCVESVAYSPRGDTVASASGDRTARLWYVETGEHCGTLVGHTNSVMTVAFSPDGNQIATGSKDGHARLWNVDTRTCSHIMEGHTDWVREVVYSPQGNQLASAGYDNTIRLWDVETGECQRVLTGHISKVKCIAYSIQGDQLVSGSWDKTVRLWDVVAGQCRAEIPNLPSEVYSIAWGKKSGVDFFVTGSEDGTVLRWDVMEERGQCIPRLCWLTTNGKLSATGASIENVRGLTPLNTQLLKQHGAIGEPEDLLHGKSK